ncbi:MAG: hypothetical protein ACXVAY_05950 [Mucilaginibacter sp.]
MKIENPAAYRFIIDEDIYLLNNDKAVLADIKHEVIEQPVTVAISAIPSTPVTVAESPVEKLPVIEFKYLGKHQKKFLILVHYTGHEFIDDAHLTALTNILKRKELAIDDVAILNLARHNNATFEQVTGFFKPQKLLFMGKISLLNGMEPLPHNQPKVVKDYTLLYSYSFDEMMDNNDLKKAFWEQVKNL